MRRQITIALALGVLLLSTVFVLGQGSPPPNARKTVLLITVFNQTCSLVEDTNAETPEAIAAATAAATDVVTGEATAEAQATAEVNANAQATQEVAVSYPILTLGDDCSVIARLLQLHSNDTLWFEIRMPNEVVWQRFTAVKDDPNPPLIDQRGRFIGCANSQVGQHFDCQVLWQSDTTYLIQIPLTVISAYIAPATSVPATTTAATISTPSPLATTLNATDTGWGSCGSCSTCGGPVEQCVTAPGNVCAWDAATCEHPKHQ